MARSFFAPNTGLDILATPKGGGPPPGIGTPVAVGSGVLDDSQSGPITITTTVDIPAGAMAIVAAASTNSIGFTGNVTDSQGNTWVSNSNVAPGTNFLRQAYLIAPALIPAGTTITVPLMGTLGRRLAQAIYCEGLAAHDTTGTGVQASTTAPVVPTPTLAQADALLLAMSYINAGHLDAWTEDPDWTTVPGAPIVATRILRLAWKKATSTVSENYEPMNSVARTIASYVDSYQGA